MTHHIDFGAILNTSLREAKRRGNPLIVRSSNQNKTHSSPPLQKEGTRTRHTELVSASHSEPSPEFLQLASSLRILPSPIGRGDKKTAFTLAEVLITLGIIGVVAALTIPTLINKYKEQVHIQQAKKAYSLIYNTLNMIKAEENLDDFSEIFSASTKNPNKCKEEVLQKLLKHLNVIKYCGYDSGCWPKTTKGQHKGDADYRFDTSFGFAKATLADGSSIGLNTYYPSNVGDKCLTRFQVGTDETTGEPIYRDSYQCGLIVIDTNGIKGPNQIGADTFYFHITPYKINQYYGNINDVIINNQLYYDK